MPTASPIELLPNELIDEIISLLFTSPPSPVRLHQPPSVHITKSQNRDLKNFSLTCSRFLDLVRPPLFSHACLELRDVDEYLSFISKSDLNRYVASVVVKVNDARNACGPWWNQFLRSIRPLRLTVIAPPSVIGSMLGTQIPEEHSWAFEIPLQTLQLECDGKNHNSMMASQIDQQSSLLDCLPWSSMLFNESSSLKSYNHYEYFLFQVPSLFNRWGLWATSRSFLEQAKHLSLSLTNLTSFTYVAVFPYYNHVQMVLDAVELMTNLRSLKIQLGPSQNDRVTEHELRASMDPSDPWMELATGYSLIAHEVRNLGKKSFLSEFTACDYEIDAVRSELDVILGDILSDGQWTHDGGGIWTKKATERAYEENNPTTVDNLA